MTVNTRTIDANPERVFDVLANGWLFPVWVVGASRMRDVEEQWPAVGAKIHHSVGAWPALINDSTSMLEWDPPRRVALQARMWPMGEATVTLDVEPDGAGSKITMTEVPTSGPFAKLPGPLVNFAIKARNVETLQRLAFLAEGRAS